MKTVENPAQIRFLGDMHNGYEFLSNMHRCTIVIDGQGYGSTEHYYQSQKATNEALRKYIIAAPTPYYAKLVASVIRKKDKDPRWHERNLGVMRTALLAKFTQNLELGEKLIATGNAILLEANEEDEFWGTGREGNGTNMLGKLLMELREKLALEKELKSLEKAFGI